MKGDFSQKSITVGWTGNTSQLTAAVTAPYGDPETKRKAMEGGATGLLTKPIDFTLLREEIDTRPGQAS
jgi:response regulator RpfG family c-di-GMP phosphodiesterase